MPILRSLPITIDHGAHSTQPWGCFRCGRALHPEERLWQDGVVVCGDCVYDHSKTEYEALVDREWPEYKGPVIIGGRTG